MWTPWVCGVGGVEADGNVLYQMTSQLCRCQILALVGEEALLAIGSPSVYCLPRRTERHASNGNVPSAPGHSKYRPYGLGRGLGDACHVLCTAVIAATTKLPPP